MVGSSHCLETQEGDKKGLRGDEDDVKMKAVMESTEKCP